MSPEYSSEWLWDFGKVGPKHLVIVTIRDNKDYVRVPFYSYYTQFTGWGGPPKDIGLTAKSLSNGRQTWFDLCG